MPIKELEQEEQQPIPLEDQRNRPRLNPRLCFGNPDNFFLDLLMEEEEQG